MEKLSQTKVQFICPSTLTYRIHNDRNYSNKSSLLSLLPWRNWLARSTVNRKVGGSSPPGSDDFITNLHFIFSANFKPCFRYVLCAVIWGYLFGIMINLYCFNYFWIKIFENAKWRFVLKWSLPGGLEPPTFRLTVERANQLRHGSLCQGKNTISFESKKCFEQLEMTIKHYLPVFCSFNICYSNLDDFTKMHKPAWRNGLARWTSNPKVVGSTPTVGVLLQVKQ